MRTKILEKDRICTTTLKMMRDKKQKETQLDHTREREGEKKRERVKDRGRERETIQGEKDKTKIDWNTTQMPVYLGPLPILICMYPYDKSK